MKIELKPVGMKAEYRLDGRQSGYEYTIYASRDDEFGAWSASVTITDWGFRTAEEAVEGLQSAVKNLLEGITGQQYAPANPPPESKQGNGDPLGWS